MEEGTTAASSPGEDAEAEKGEPPLQDPVGEAAGAVRVLTTAEVAERVRLHPKTVERAIRGGQLRA